MCEKKTVTMLGKVQYIIMFEKKDIEVVDFGVSVLVAEVCML